MTANPNEQHLGVADGIEVSVIIVNYNGRPFLKKCLQSISRNISCIHEIIIVDNNSIDGSREYLSQEWPEVKLVSSSENLGFARGNNRGAELAGGKYLLLLNNDTEMLEPVLPLLNYLEEHPGTAVAGGRLRNPDGTIQPSVGYDHTPLRLVFSWMLPRTCTWFSTRQLYEKRTEFYSDTHHDVHWVSGAFLCTRKQLWEDIKGFDSEIFMYVEDVDLCRRVRERGAKVAYFAGADVCHFEGGGKKGMSGHALLATVDSYRHLLKKHSGHAVRVSTCIALSLVFLVRAGLYMASVVGSRDSIHIKKAGFFLQAAGRLLWGGRKTFPISSGGVRK